MIGHVQPETLYQVSNGTPTCFDLFSGAGGLSVGFVMAGGTPIGAVDFDADSIETYRKNFPMAEDVACSPIESWHPSTKPGKVDVIIGGPPCQGFSLARGLRFVDDPRNHLYKYFVKLVELYQPKWIVMENVEGIVNIGGGAILRQVLEDFSNIGYLLDYRVMNMAMYGVPQLRKRAIFIGNRIGKTYHWPQVSHYDPRREQRDTRLFNDDLLPYNSVNSALSDLVLPQGNYFSHRANSQMRGPRNRCAHTEPAFTLRVRGDEFAICEEPATHAFIPNAAPSEEITYRAPQNSLQELLRHNRPPWAPNLSAKISRRKRLPKLKGTRRLTIREQARLQTFPDWFDFSGRITSQAKQVGNAVPPLLGYQLFAELFKLL